MKTLRIGYIPLLDAAIPIAAAECGFAEAQGLKLELVREVSWANIRDKLVLDMLDASHMLAPLAVATSLGLGHIKVPVVAPFSLNANGNCITLAASLYRELEDVLGRAPENAREAAEALGLVVARRKKQGEPQLTFAVVYPYSLHAFLVRHWLRAGGINPARDVQFVTIPPPFMGASLNSGLIHGYCVGEPWNSRAVEDGTGCIVAFGAEINRHAPDKVLAISEKKAGEAETTTRLLRAYNAAAKWCESEANRSNLANIMAQPQYLNVAPRTVLRALNGTLPVTPTQMRSEANFIRFGGEEVNRPDPRKGRWIYAEIMHALGHDMNEKEAEIAASVFRTDLYEAAMGPPQTQYAADPIGLLFGPPFQADELEDYAAAL